MRERTSYVTAADLLGPFSSILESAAVWSPILSPIPFFYSPPSPSVSIVHITGDDVPQWPSFMITFIIVCASAIFVFTVYMVRARRTTGAQALGPSVLDPWPWTLGQPLNIFPPPPPSSVLPPAAPARHWHLLAPAHDGKGAKQPSAAQARSQ